MYDSCEAVCNVYGGIISHKLKKYTRCGDSILFITYYGINIQSPTGLFIVTHIFWSTVRLTYSTREGSISTQPDILQYEAGGYVWIIKNVWDIYGAIRVLVLSMIQERTLLSLWLYINYT